MPGRIFKFVFAGSTVVALGLLGTAAAVTSMSFVKTRAEADIYRQRLLELHDRHQRLATNFNDAVRKTAVTELIVRNREEPERPSLSVRVRNLTGEIKVIETDFDPRGEIYVDYVVLDGRLWIRRVFDADTPPSKGLQVNPEITDVNWNDSSAQVGKAVYRALDEGRWVITVTGSGSLGLVRAGGPDDPPGDLVTDVAIEDFDEIETQVSEAKKKVGAGDVWNWLVGRDSPFGAEPASDH